LSAFGGSPDQQEKNKKPLLRSKIGALGLCVPTKSGRNLSASGGSPDQQEELVIPKHFRNKWQINPVLRPVNAVEGYIYIKIFYLLKGAIYSIK
jgi:thymidine phosphorylase